MPILFTILSMPIVCSMKPLYILVFVGLSYFAKAQTSSFTITMNGIEELKLGMKKEELEKLINQNISLSHPDRRGVAPLLDTVHINYKGLETDIVFAKQYTGENSYDLIIQEIECNSDMLRTKKGICIGDDKLKVINTYEGFTLWLVPGYLDDSYTTKSKNRSSIWLHGDTTDSAIIFRLENNKVVSMSVCYYEKGG